METFENRQTMTYFDPINPQNIIHVFLPWCLKTSSWLRLQRLGSLEALNSWKTPETLGTRPGSCVVYKTAVAHLCGKPYYRTIFFKKHSHIHSSLWFSSQKLKVLSKFKNKNRQNGSQKDAIVLDSAKMYTMLYSEDSWASKYFVFRC